jgi:hypothetical protein
LERSASKLQNTHYKEGKQFLNFQFFAGFAARCRKTLLLIKNNKQSKK